MTADDLFKALSVRYPAQEYALLAQVRNCTGFSRQARTADALLMSLWPSRGLELAGLEIKVDRRDWIREKADPEKADAIGKYCDRWWIVTPPNVVPLEDLPPAWGLLEYDGDKKKWKVRQPASKLKAKPLSREFLAAMLRKVAETSVPQASIQDRIDEAVQKDRDARLYEIKHLREDSQVLRQRIQQFEEASGVAIDTTKWSYEDPKALGRAVRQVMNGDHERIAERLSGLKVLAEQIVQDVAKRLEGLPCKV